MDVDEQKKKEKARKEKAARAEAAKEKQKAEAANRSQQAAKRRESIKAEKKLIEVLAVVSGLAGEVPTLLLKAYKQARDLGVSGTFMATAEHRLETMGVDMASLTWVNPLLEPLPASAGDATAKAQRAPATPTGSSKKAAPRRKGPEALYGDVAISAEEAQDYDEAYKRDMVTEQGAHDR